LPTVEQQIVSNYQKGIGKHTKLTLRIKKEDTEKALPMPPFITGFQTNKHQRKLRRDVLLKRLQKQTQKK